MAQVNEGLLYQPDEQPRHPESFLHGFQDVMGMMGSMAATAAIVAFAGGQSESYLSWILFTAFAVCGLGTVFQTMRVWRFGSGYPLRVSAGSAFIAVSISALVEGGPAMLSTLIAASALIQFVLISRLSLLRRIMTPAVSGTILMLLSATIIPVVLGQLSDLPEGSPGIAAPVLGGVALAILMGLRLFATARLQQWGPLIAILVGCVIAASLGLYDFGGVVDAPWIGIPSLAWPGFDLSFDATFWALLPGFVIVNMATSINSINETVVIQQVSWRRPRATDFRVVQGAHNLLSLANLVGAAVGALPVRIASSHSARVLLTGVAARRMGIYAGLILLAVAFLPKIMALVVAAPRPVLAAYIVFTLSLLFVQGMRSALQGGMDGKKAAIIGVSLWIGIGFQNQFILPDLLTGTVGTLLSNGMTTGSLCVIFLTLLMGLASGRRKRLNVEMSLSSLPRIDAFLRDFAAGASWSEASASKLRSAGEETLSCLLSQEGDQADNNEKRLVINARRDRGLIELEFMAVSEGGNLEDKLAYLSEQPEIQEEEEISFRLLRHYASSVEHHKYHDIDIITVQVSAAA